MGTDCVSQNMALHLRIMEVISELQRYFLFKTGFHTVNVSPRMPLFIQGMQSNTRLILLCSCYFPTAYVFIQLI